MKPKKMLFVAASAALFGLVNSVSGQYGTAREGGSAMPKVQDLLNEQEPVPTIAPATVVVTTSYEAAKEDGIAASPKVRELLNQLKTVRSTPAGEVLIVEYGGAAQNGAAAPPKVREKLNERGSTFMVAPLVTPEK